METLASHETIGKNVRILSWGLIVVSVFLLLRGFIFLPSFTSVVNLQLATRNFIPPLEINYTLYFIQAGIEFLLCILVFISATYLLKYRNLWRKTLIYLLIVGIIFFMVSPIITYYNIDIVRFGVVANTKLLWSYLLSIVISIYFIVTIVRLSKEEVKLLFK